MYKNRVRTKFAKLNLKTVSSGPLHQASNGVHFKEISQHVEQFNFEYSLNIK